MLEDTVSPSFCATVHLLKVMFVLCASIFKDDFAETIASWVLPSGSKIGDRVRLINPIRLMHGIFEYEKFLSCHENLERDFNMKCLPDLDTFASTSNHLILLHALPRLEPYL